MVKVPYGLVAAGLCAGIAFAGPITPPPGPVASTPGPEPRIAINATNTPGDGDSVFKITQRGSYYLTGNITGVSGKHGIEITASGVTIDLAGFDLAGVPGMGAFDGVSVTANDLKHIAVVNGSVRAWGDAGVDLGSTNTLSGSVSGVAASDNAGTGISVGPGSTVSDCSASGNAGRGITTNTGGAVFRCVATSNGVDGFAIGVGGTISDCVASFNIGSGILTTNGATVVDCTASNNSGNGVNAANGCVITECVSYSNDGVGVSVGTGCTVAACTMRLNGLHGIQCVSSCMIRDNMCVSSGSGATVGAGIFVTGNTSRIEGNTCVSGDTGIEVDGTANVIVRNTCGLSSGNDWEITANNFYGAIVDRSGIATPPAFGQTGASTLGTTDANANFSN